MEKTALEAFVARGLSQREIASELGKSQSSVKHWLKKYNLSTNYLNKDIFDEDGIRICPVHGYSSFAVDPTGRFRCRECRVDAVNRRRVLLKQKAIDYKGGSCQICGYDRCPKALEFHHLDPSEKDFSISDKIASVHWELIESELDKCVLLCANCHREAHDGMLDL